MFYLASNGSSISRIKGHDEAERFNEILLDDSEEETDNENGTPFHEDVSISQHLFSSSIVLSSMF